MIERIMKFIFGPKLPCCNRRRKRVKPGTRYACQCGKSYMFAKWESKRDEGLRSLVANWKGTRNA
jgi:hypothetical protein